MKEELAYFERNPLVTSWVAMLFAIMILNSCKLDVSDLTARDKVSVSSNVWLFRTSRDVYTIADDEGVGIVYGNITRIGYESRDKRYLFVEYRRFENPPILEFARVDLNSSKVEILTNPSDSLERLLRPVGEFSP